MPEIIPNWHPMVVHFAVALLLTAVLLFVIAAALARMPLGPSLTSAARWNLGLGFIAALTALATGWGAYNTVDHDAASHANMTVHMRWAFATTCLFAIAAAFAFLDRRRISGASAALLIGLVGGAGALAVTGWLGAENVYRYGLGVMTLPATDDHDHAGHHHNHLHDGSLTKGETSTPTDAHTGPLHPHSYDEGANHPDERAAGGARQR